VFGGGLFSRSLDEFFINLRKKMIEEIDAIPPEEIVGADGDNLAMQFMEKFQVACPVLSDDIGYDEPPFSPRAEQITVKVYVPFTGEAQLFQYSGRSAPVIELPIQVDANQLVIPMRVECHRIGDLPQRMGALLKRIREAGLAPITEQLKFFNPDLKVRALQRIKERQTDLAGHEHRLGELRKTGFAVRRRNDGTERLIIPVKPKIIIVQPRPTVADPDPELSLEDYDEILSVIQSMAKVYERSPSVFRAMNEEHLRTILLVGLNGIFKGQATGETFNGEGKNDILIREKDNNIFIGECLFWNGTDKFRKKLTEQLFRYSTWRDSKLAAIVFNRKKDFTAVVQKMKEVAAGLESRVAELSYAGPSACRHRFRREDDPAKHFILTCLAFEVPA
jgi:hypothetical protein